MGDIGSADHSDSVIEVIIPEASETADSNDPDTATPLCAMEDTIVSHDECPEPPTFFPDLGIESFTSLPGSIDVAQLTPQVPVTYWEERFCFFGDNPCQVRRSHGTKCGDASNQATCVREFDFMWTDRGFGQQCHPMPCYYFLAVNRGDENFVVDNSQLALNDFLAPIENVDEVMYLAESAGFTTGILDPTVHGYREVNDGWEILVPRLSQLCRPVTYDRYLLRCGRDGRLTPLCRQLYQLECGTCT